MRLRPPIARGLRPKAANRHRLEAEWSMLAALNPRTGRKIAAAIPAASQDDDYCAVDSRYALREAAQLGGFSALEAAPVAAPLHGRQEPSFPETKTAEHHKIAEGATYRGGPSRRPSAVGMLDSSRVQPRMNRGPDMRVSQRQWA